MILGLANKKTVTIQPGKDQSVVLATTKTKKQNKPAALLQKSILKKEFRRMAKAVVNHVIYKSFINIYGSHVFCCSLCMNCCMVLWSNVFQILVTQEVEYVEKDFIYPSLVDANFMFSWFSCLSQSNSDCLIWILNLYLFFTSFSLPILAVMKH